MTGVNRPNPRLPAVRRRPLDYERVPPERREDNDDSLWRNLLGRLGLFLIGAIISGLGVFLMVTAFLPLIVLGAIICLVGLMFLAAALLPRRWTEPVAAALGRVGKVLGSLLEGWWVWWW